MADLTREQREAILAGDYSALKYDSDPGDVEGQQIPILRDRARRQLVHGPKLFSDHSPPVVDVQEVPEFWWLWIELGKPRRHKDGGWRVPFAVHDQRQKDRTLRAGGPPGPPRDAGLRTRKRDKLRPKGEGVGNYTDESARGYGAGGDQLLDRGGVDDDTLKEFRVRADARFAEHRCEVASETERRRQERLVRQQLRQRLEGLDPTAQEALLAGIQRLIGEAGEKRDVAA